MKDAMKGPMKQAFVLLLLLGGTFFLQRGDAQRVVAAGQILFVSGPGNTMVTTTGPQTSGNCVSIDANGNHIASGSACGTGSGGGGSDIPSFVICNAPGCGSEVSANYYFISNPTGITFDECGVNLAVAATLQTVIFDIQDASGVSIFGGSKLNVTVANGTTTQFQSTFLGSPQTAAKGSKLKAVVTQNDTNGAAQFAYIKCRVH